MSFFLYAQKSNEENKFVFDKELIRTFIQLDEIYGIEKNRKYNDDFFYKPYLTNVVLLNDSNYLIQVSYIGTDENTVLLQANSELIAHKTNNSFKLSFKKSIFQDTINSPKSVFPIYFFALFISPAIIRNANLINSKSLNTR